MNRTTKETIGYWDSSDKPSVTASYHWGSGPVAQASMMSHLNEQSLEAIRQIVREEVQRASAHSEQMTAHQMHELYGMTYRGFSFQELDEIIDFYRMHRGGK